MADVYLIYAREDEGAARNLFDNLSPRWSVWWDQLVKERFSDEIVAEMAKTRCAVVLWSKASRIKDTVIDEVKLAQKQSVKIVCASLDGSEPAYGFGGYSTSDLSGWMGENDHPGYKLLFGRLMSVLPAPQPPSQPNSLAYGRIPLPAMFLSVSSFETQLVPEGAVKALALARAPAILVSAWDLVRRRKPEALIEALREYRQTGGFILLDSGNYEASRLSTKHWRVDDLQEALAAFPPDWAFAFDKIRASWPKKEMSAERITETILERVQCDQALTSAPILPVVHAPRLSSSGYLVDVLPDISRRVAEALQPAMIGIPERELGAGMGQRVKTMQAIRRELNKLTFYQPVHLLGTGNPWTIAIMTAAGADAFDGLEWCRVIVDHQDDRLNHFQHFDLFTDQTQFADLAVARDALNDDKVDFAGKAAFHNIDYFMRYNQELRDAVSQKRIEGFVNKRLPKVAVEMLHRITEGLFD
ncbi:toll/interleukin-1 receptor domain-containing protein [Hoeflea sp. AS60]|uniref:toll/interleukin-1 receptor domain-containing protein n=1 Tax=Hoeflea sp. AS60 TaxID=3135780 RepID=UPI003178A0D4